MRSEGAVGMQHMIDQPQDQIVGGKFLGLAPVGVAPPADRSEAATIQSAAELVDERAIINKACGNDVVHPELKAQIEQNRKSLVVR